MNDLLPMPPKRPKKYEFRGGTCPKHGNACAMRRCRLTLGPWECVECAHEAGTLQPDLAPVASPVPEQQKPPATPHAVEASQPADTTERGAGAACTPIDNTQLFTAIDAIRKAVPPEAWPTPAIEVAALHDIARAAREASLALDTLTQRIKHALESAPPPVVAAAQLSTAFANATAKKIEALNDMDAFVASALFPDQAALIAVEREGLPTWKTVPSLVPESAAESQADGGGADADLPPGWRAVRYAGPVVVVYWYDRIPDFPRVWLEGGEWVWRSHDVEELQPAPTMLTAMCAALGIRTSRSRTDGADDYYWAATLSQPNGSVTCLASATHDGVCRLALERYHARQQAPERAEGCMCPTEGVIHPRCPRCAQEFSSRLELEAKDGRAVL